MTNADIEADFQISYNNLHIIVADAKIVLNNYDPSLMCIAANLNQYQYIIGPNASWLQYSCTKN